jgi:hypothetical protein
MPRTPGHPYLLAAVAAALCSSPGAAQAPPAAPDPSPAPAARDEVVARQACSACHAFPPPEILPREAWTAVIYEMVGLIIAGIGVPEGAKAPPADFDVDAVERFYRSRAPVTLPASEAWPAPGEHAARFARHPLKLPGGATRPLIANVRFLDLDGRGRVEIVATDMANGLVLRASPGALEGGLSVIERVAAPCHTAVVDLDRDGRLDLIVADLGEVPPSDHLKAGVAWLQRQADGSYRKRTIASGLPRVADVEAADFDGDGDLDLAVAAFGWRQQGSLLLLENRTQDWSLPVFAPRTLDTRTGAIHVPFVDLDGDGRLDLVTVFSQHHEAVVAFLNTRDGLRPQAIYAAPHPSWGSSGIDVVDLDRDGDLDVVLTHGDMLDDFLVKPYHGIQWLENRGGFPFVAHTLATLPGAMGARAVDLDGDGDLDVVAVTYVPDPRRGDQAPRPLLPSLVWLEQVAPGRFERRTLELGGRHVSVDAADFDGDGDIDLVMGQFGSAAESAVEVWENLAAKTP